MNVDYTPLGLASLFDVIRRDLAADYHPDNAFRALTDLAVRVVPGVEYAGISRGRGDTFVTVAPTHELVRQVDDIQYGLHSGPCVDAITQDTVFRADDLRTDVRWPEFGARAFETAGIVSMLSFRLFLEDDDLVAGLNMYSTRVAAFDDAAQTIGLIIATHGALAVSVARAREQARNLGTALKTSREIGIAMGILMTQSKINRDQAFDLLRVASQHTHRKLADIAQEVADTGLLELPEHDTKRR